MRVRILGELYSSTAAGPRRIKCIWQDYLEIYNSTAFNALGVAFVWPDPVRKLPLTQFEPPHVNAMETRSLKFKTERDFPKEQVVACRDRFKELLPDELKTAVLFLQYQNDKGITFYTRYERNGDTENSMFHRFRPKS